MKKLKIILVVLILPTVIKADIASSQDTTTTINTRALENLVYLAASNQGKWPEVVQSTTITVAQKALVLDNTLDSIAISQKLAQEYGEAILKDVENSNCYCELGYKFVKFSGCLDTLKKSILDIIITKKSHECECSNTNLLRGLAAFERFKLSVNPGEYPVNYVKIINDSLLSYKAEEVAVNDYWKSLIDISNYLAENDAAKQIFADVFSDELKADMQIALKEYRVDPNYYGTELNHSAVYSVVNSSVTEFWIELWSNPKTPIMKPFILKPEN